MELIVFHNQLQVSVHWKKGFFFFKCLKQLDLDYFAKQENLILPSSRLRAYLLTGGKERRWHQDTILQMDASIWCYMSLKILSVQEEGPETSLRSSRFLHPHQFLLLSIQIWDFGNKKHDVISSAQTDQRLVMRNIVEEMPTQPLEVIPARNVLVCPAMAAMGGCARKPLLEIQIYWSWVVVIITNILQIIFSIRL